MSSDLKVLIIELEAKITDEKARFEVLITKLKQDQAEIDARILKLKQDQAEREAKKNRKFQIRYIQIAKKILNEEPIIKYRLPFLNGLELDAFFQKYRIALEVFDIQTIFYKTLTPEYLDWHTKLSGLPSGLTDKICFKLYKRYKKETGHEPCRRAHHVLFAMENMGIMDYKVNGIGMEQNIVLLASLQAIKSSS
ncbi:hypothetical protein GLOIN_2v1870575 [Rhizophagus irregularis DAOM 181602=DAOM 197198]|uniref:Uncharacterized protein n=2 Tax=Rhizophagus irregularis TaxID=588596 RepID=A0A2P4QLM9_RHIID|nr:hypothetical protein GLOIN_2v1870575 [Rhizophagus irregularis DAOM 181602=DAOM 197198]POG78535.1 hypothetical protein GLOIN_2v1870575 [Rhizophagus irregularis DAOM 181602=DAOM 197198]|eukprot:XP_025185401.1 hypothetical protein GLOIN_2v1870575 [Rhizophagus irregularis DAOM 181602=DAOM 197198]